MPRLIFHLAAPIGAMLLTLGAQTALADGGRLMPGNVPQAYAQECAACHLAYPPGLLPSASWGRIISGLGQHYGVDASLDAATVRQLGTWLQTYAGTSRRVTEAPPQDRITRSTWFLRQHEVIDPAVWKLPSVRSAAQCAACHVGAEQGRFDDDALRFPAGLSPHQRRAWND